MECWSVGRRKTGVKFMMVARVSGVRSTFRLRIGWGRISPDLGICISPQSLLDQACSQSVDSAVCGSAVVASPSLPSSMSRHVSRDKQKSSNPYWQPAAPSRNSPLPHQQSPRASSARPPPFPKPAVVQKREDVQPNEGSKLIPACLRRPTEPPTIKPAASLAIASTSGSQPAQNSYNQTENLPRGPRNHHQPARTYHHPYRHPNDPSDAQHWTRNYPATNLNRSTSYRSNTYRRDHNDHTRWSNRASNSSISNPPAHPWRRQGESREGVNSYRPAAPDRRLDQDYHTGNKTERNSPSPPRKAEHSVHQTSMATASTSGPTSAPKAQSSSLSSQVPTPPVHLTLPNAEMIRPGPPTSPRPLAELTIQPRKDNEDMDVRKSETVTNVANPLTPLTVNTQPPSTANPPATAEPESKSKAAESHYPTPTAIPENKSNVSKSPRSTKGKVAERPRSPSRANQLANADTTADDLASESSNAPNGTNSRKRAPPPHIHESATNGKEIESSASSQSKPPTSNNKEDAQPEAKKIKITPSAHQNPPALVQTSAERFQKSNSNRREDRVGLANAPAPQTSSSSYPRRSLSVQPQNKPPLRPPEQENAGSCSNSEDRFKKHAVVSVNQVLASCTVQQSGTRTSVANMVISLMRTHRVGSIGHIEFLAFGGKEFKEAYLSIAFSNEEAAHKARSRKEFPIPQPLTYMGKPLLVFSRKPNVTRHCIHRARQLHALFARNKDDIQDPWIFRPNESSLPRHEPSMASAKVMTSRKPGSTTHSQVKQGSAAPQSPPRAVPDLTSKTALGQSDVPVDKGNNTQVAISSKKTEPRQLDTVDNSRDQTPRKISCKPAAAPSELASGSQPSQDNELPSLDPTGLLSSQVQTASSDDPVDGSMVPGPAVDASGSPSYLDRDSRLQNTSEKNPASVEMRQPRKDSIQPELCLIKENPSTSSCTASNLLISTSIASNHITLQDSSPSQRLDTNSQTGTTSLRDNLGTSKDPTSLSTGVAIQDHELAKFSLPEDQTDEAADLPLHVVKHEMPQNCKEAHPSHATNRLHFKLQKIRIASSKEQTVLDSSWTGEHLILYVVPNANPTVSATNQSGSRQDNDLVAPQACQEGRNPPDPSSLSDSEDVKRVLPVSSPASVVALDDLPVAAEAIEKHRTWPFSPKPSYFDVSVSQDLQKTLKDFLTTFFRLWEGSREDLRHLYDESAVFSNILARQGRKASSITKSTGWSNIYNTIRKLPALSNEPLADSILDAWPVATFPPRLLCVVHGTFMEFDKASKRAFDRTFVLRPVDVNLNPSEGCLGLLKWIILSDTLTIRKNSCQATAVIEGFRQHRPSQADRCNRIRDLSSPNLEGTSHSNQRPSCAQPTQARGRSTLSAASHSPRLSSTPLLPPNSPSTSSDTPLATITSRSFRTPAQLPSTNRPTPEVAPATSQVDLVKMQAELKVMQLEIERLKSSSHVPNQATSTPPRQQPSQEIDTVSTPTNHQSHSRRSERQPSPRPSKTQNSDIFDIKSASNYLHKGLGVARKRLMVPTNLSSYLVVSMRGDILSWDKTNRSKVQLLLSGASPTDLVDSACFSSSTQTLVVGSRPSSTARDALSSQISLVKMRQSPTGSLMCERVKFDDSLHEGGIHATCLLPQSDRPGMPLAFVTAGQEKHLVIWKIIRGHKETSKILSDHTSTIQILAPCNHRNWLMSGGQDGKVYATDIVSNHRRLLLAAKHPIIDIQLNEVYNRNNIMVTTANKNPESQFRYCDLRMPDAALAFGFPAAADGVSFDSSVKKHSKGSLMDNYFAYPTGENGGVRIWDLRSTRTHLLKVSSTPGLQTYFESLKTLLTLDRDTLTHVEFR